MFCESFSFFNLRQKKKTRKNFAAAVAAKL